MEAIGLFSLLDQIHKCQVVIPEFQRHFVCKTSQVEELLNSIANGFFIGTILMLEDLPDNRFSSSVTSHL